MSADISKIIRLRRQVYAYKLDGADLLRRFTDAELAKFYNGIGPESFPAPLREAIDNLTPDLQCVALIHDTEHSTGSYADIEGKESRADFHAANTRFKENGYAVAAAKYCWFVHPFKRLALRAASRAYAKICDRFGWDVWVKSHTTVKTPNERTGTK